ncbi:RNA-binding protein Raly-like [Macrobrachium nipponense]|uniref:RNA-binding protein Raly-like n=1 Tax=Macrobrachium nipponense TaxID=159736 RepID=UPI0030C85481
MCLPKFDGRVLSKRNQLVRAKSEEQNTVKRNPLVRAVSEDHTRHFLVRSWNREQSSTTTLVKNVLVRTCSDERGVVKKNALVRANSEGRTDKINNILNESRNSFVLGGLGGLVGGGRGGGGGGGGGSSAGMGGGVGSGGAGLEEEGEANRVETTEEETSESSLDRVRYEL